MKTELEVKISILVILLLYFAHILEHFSLQFFV